MRRTSTKSGEKNECIKIIKTSLKKTCAITITMLCKREVNFEVNFLEQPSWYTCLLFLVTTFAMGCAADCCWDCFFLTGSSLARCRCCKRVLKLEVRFSRAPHFEQQVDHVFSEGLGPTDEHHAFVVAGWQESRHLFLDQFPIHTSMVHGVPVSHLPWVTGEGIHGAPAQGVCDIEVPVALEVVQLLFE